MSQLAKIRDKLEAINHAVDNVMFGRMPMEYLEAVFERQVEYIRAHIESEKHNRANR